MKVLHAPCHTSGHVLYYVESRTDSNATPIIFTGDLIFPYCAEGSKLEVFLVLVYS